MLGFIHTCVKPSPRSSRGLAARTPLAAAVPANLRCMHRRPPRLAQGKSRQDPISAPACRGRFGRSWALGIRPPRHLFGAAAGGGRSRRPRRVRPIGVTSRSCMEGGGARDWRKGGADKIRSVLQRAAAVSDALGLSGYARRAISSEPPRAAGEAAAGSVEPRHFTPLLLHVSSSLSC